MHNPRRDEEAAAIDKRIVRTRQALLNAFFDLVLSRRYGEITVASIVERAGVGRSTFYEHFTNKNAILDASLDGPFGVLADTISELDNTARLDTMLQHFWDNRVLGKALFTGAMRRRVSAALARLIERRLDAARLSRPGALLLPPRLAAIQLAEGMFAPITAWISAAPCSSAALAHALRRSARATLAALQSDSPARLS